jgi:hypothetical protein
VTGWQPLGLSSHQQAPAPGRLVGEDTSIAISGAQTDIPLFVRDSGIVPMLAEARNRAPASGGNWNLEVRHYGESEGVFQLYDDDGELRTSRAISAGCRLRSHANPMGAWPEKPGLRPGAIAPPAAWPHGVS